MKDESGQTVETRWSIRHRVTIMPQAQASSKKTAAADGKPADGKEVNFRTSQAQVKRERMLGKLLNATMSVCGDTSRRGTAVIDDVVREAGVSRGAFYWYFDSLDEAIEMLGRRLADEITSETTLLFSGQKRPTIIRAACGGQVMLFRASMDPAWAGYLSKIHVLLDDSTFVKAVQRNLEIGKKEGVFHYDSLTLVTDYQIGAIMNAIRRCASPSPPPMPELIEINRLILCGLGVPDDQARAAAEEAKILVEEIGPTNLSWWQPAAPAARTNKAD